MRVNTRLQIKNASTESLSLWLWELRNQSGEHRGRVLAGVETIFKFLGVFMQMLFGNVNVGAADAAFKVLPKVLQIVDVRFAFYIFASPVINRLMVESRLFNPL